MSRRLRAVKSEEDQRRERALQHFFSEEAEGHLQRFGANSLGYGYKEQNGNSTGIPSLRVYVPIGAKPSQKGAVPRNCDDASPPLKLHDPASGDEFEYCTDVAPARRVRLEGTYTPGNSRLPGGVGCAGDQNKGGTEGTLGGWAWDRLEGRVVLLSAEHVLGSVGSTVEHPPIGEKRKLGDVIRARGPSVRSDVTVDCAIASIGPDDFLLEVLEIGPAIMATTAPSIELPVEKTGHMTGHTYGRVSDPYWTGWIDSPMQGVRPLFARGCMRILPQRVKWTVQGDSGSLVFGRDTLDGTGVKPVVGLHFAGDAGDANVPPVGIACPISTVFERLEIETLTDGMLTLIIRAAPNGGNTQLIIKRKELLADLYRELPLEGPAKPVSDLLDVHRGEFVGLLVQHEDLRHAASQAVGAVIQQDTELTSVLDRSITAETIDLIRRFGSSVSAHASSSLTQTVERLLNIVPYLNGQSLRQFFELGPTLPKAPGPSPIPAQLYLTIEAVREFLREDRRDERLMEEYGADAVSARMHDGLPVVAIAFRAQGAHSRPLKPVPPYLDWVRGGEIQLAIPTHVIRGARRPTAKR